MANNQKPDVKADGRKKSGPEPRRVVVADDEHLVAEGIAAALRVLEMEVLGVCTDGEHVVECCRHNRPDLAIVDIRMPRRDGIEAAKILYEEMRIPVIIVSAFSDPEYAKASAQVGVFGYLLKPVTADDIRCAVSVAWARYNEALNSQQELKALTQRLEDRKIIEMAKWVLVSRLGLTEDAAMKRLQKQARDNRRTIVDVAKGIVENQELFGQGA